jgi:hypothetical protein
MVMPTKIATSQFFLVRKRHNEYASSLNPMCVESFLIDGVHTYYRYAGESRVYKGSVYSHNLFDIVAEVSDECE